MLKWLLMICLSWSLAIHGQPKHHLSICSVLKNDSVSWVTEWIEYHRLIGVDHFYLYLTTNNAAIKSVLTPYLRKGIVSLIPWIVKSEESEDTMKQACFALGIETTAYEHAIYVKTPQETEWMVCLGLQEYLLPIVGDSVLTILQKYQNAPGIVFSSDCFDASRNRFFSHHQLVIENTGMIELPHKWDSPTSKLIFKPSLCEGFMWPPYQCVFKQGLQPVQVSRSEIRLNFYKPRDRHFEFKNRALVDNRAISRQELSEILSLGYEVEDQEKSIQRFVPRLREVMTPGVPFWSSGNY